MGHSLFGRYGVAVLAVAAALLARLALDPLVAHPAGPHPQRRPGHPLARSADENLQRAREMIERQVQHLTRMVDDLLDVSRITRGKIILQKERLDLVGLARLAAEDCHSAFEQ